MESRTAVFVLRKPVRRLSAAALALAMAAGMFFFRCSGVRAAQPPAPYQPAQSLPQSASPRGETAPQSGPAKDAEPENSGRQAAADCASLLKLAIDLKAEMDKTNKDELSVNVIRKAGEIEQLARKVRDTANKTPGRN